MQKGKCGGSSWLARGIICYSFFAMLLPKCFCKYLACSYFFNLIQSHRCVLAFKSAPMKCKRQFLLSACLVLMKSLLFQILTISISIFIAISVTGFLNFQLSPNNSNLKQFHQCIKARNTTWSHFILTLWNTTWNRISIPHIVSRHRQKHLHLHLHHHYHHHYHHHHYGLQRRMGFAALVLAMLCGFVASTPLSEKVDTGGDDNDDGGDEDDDEIWPGRRWSGGPGPDRPQHHYWQTSGFL